MTTGFGIMRSVGEPARGGILSVTTGLLFLLPAGTVPQPANHAITLDGRATILVDPEQPAPIRLAAQDLASDMQKVFGHATPARLLPLPLSGVTGKLTTTSSITRAPVLWMFTKRLTSGTLSERIRHSFS
jgi:hypothetical protein